ncbi:Gfo/Idh/MocA family protein (plasmid) [Falsihalocynthiibacter sp. SS001]|uniref:Gfo/Idh/MocA family protein n=1 Tax=Falsihalocynthiibacter sp. SS001 TaxID=3349698 RepID=UPI0036D3C8F9
MPKTPVKLAVIGLGMAAKPHLAALKELAGKVEVGGVFARSPETRQVVADTWGWPTYESLDDIAKSDVDGAIVITPPHARAEIVKTLANAGKAILMEKPVERDLARATEIVEICESANVPLGIVFQNRFRGGAIALRELIDSGKAGTIRKVQLNLPWWRDQSYYDEPGRGTYAGDGGGVLITQAIHFMDLMLSLTGPVAKVSALTGTTAFHQMEAEDFANAGMVFANGAFGALTATTASFPGAAETLEIDCDHASVRLLAGELTIHWRDGRTETIGELTKSGGGSDPMDFPCDWHRDLIADFAASLREGRAPMITGREALRVHRLIQAIEKSAKTEKQVTVETDE